MMNTKPSARWLDQTADGGKFAVALGAGLLLELAALALLSPMFTRPAPPPAQTQARVQLTIEAPPAPKPPPPLPQPKPQPVQPVPPPPVKPPPPQPQTPPLPTPPPPAPLPRPRPALQRMAHHLAPPVTAPRPPAITPPPTASLAAPPPPPTPAAPSAGQVDLFRDAVRRAVQQVANSVYPRGAPQGGAVGITITYLNGRVLSVALARSSGFPLLDAAALEAGRVADYPPPPAAFANHVFPWDITVIFQAPAPSVDSD